MAGVRTVGQALGIACVNWHRRAYLQRLAHASRVWQWDTARRSLKPISLHQILPREHELKLLQAPQIHGESWLSDQVAICTLVQMRRPRALFEFGTFRGQMTLNMAMNAPADAQIVTLDIPPDNRHELPDWDQTVDDALVGQLIRNSEYAERITQVFDDSRRLDTGPYAGKMEFIFIDACHDYEFVVNDSEKAFQMLAPDGVIAWHDYSPVQPGVCRYLEDLAQKREVFWVEGTQVAFARGKTPCT